MNVRNILCASLSAILFISGGACAMNKAEAYQALRGKLATTLAGDDFSWAPQCAQPVLPEHAPILRAATQDNILACCIRYYIAIFNTACQLYTIEDRTDLDKIPPCELRYLDFVSIQFIRPFISILRSPDDLNLIYSYHEIAQHINVPEICCDESLKQEGI